MERTFIVIDENGYWLHSLCGANSSLLQVGFDCIAGGEGRKSFKLQYGALL